MPFPALFFALAARAAPAPIDPPGRRVVAELAWIHEVPLLADEGLEFAVLDDLDGDGANELAVALPVFHFLGREDWPRGGVFVLSGADGAEREKLLEPYENFPHVCDWLRWGTRLRNVGDLDGDGHSDLALEEYACGDEFCPFTRFTVLGVAPLAPRFSLESAAPCTNDVLGLGDIDLDGRDDLLVAQSSASSFLRAISGRDASTIRRSARALSVRSERCALPTRLQLVDDVDGDGFDDVLVTGDPEGGVTIVSAASGEIVRRVELPRPPSADTVSTIAPFGDVDGDGCFDLLVHRGNTRDWWGTLCIRSVDGRWERELMRACLAGPYARLARLPDVDGDAVSELALCAYDREYRSIELVSGRTGGSLGSIAIPDLSDGVAASFGGALGASREPDGSASLFVELDHWRFDASGERLPIVGMSVAKFVLHPRGQR